MSERAPRLTADEVAKALRRLGFERVRQKGSHAYFEHPDGRTVTVAMHTGKILKPKTLAAIAERAGVTISELAGRRG